MFASTVTVIPPLIFTPFNVLPDIIFPFPAVPIITSVPPVILTPLPWFAITPAPATVVPIKLLSI